MITELVSALLAVRVQITKYETTKQEVKQENIQTTPQASIRLSGQTNYMDGQRNNPVYESSLGSDGKAIQEKICQVFKENCSEATTVFRCESGLNPIAVSPTGDFGVSQINLQAHYRNIKGNTREEKISNLLDVNYNLAFAFNLFSKQSWVPWLSSRYCWGNEVAMK